MPAAGLPATDATDVVRLLDDQTFETLDRFVLGPNELACSLGSMSFANDAQVRMQQLPRHTVLDAGARAPGTVPCYIQLLLWSRSCLCCRWRCEL